SKAAVNSGSTPTERCETSSWRASASASSRRAGLMNDITIVLRRRGVRDDPGSAAHHGAAPRPETAMVEAKSSPTQLSAGPSSARFRANFGPDSATCRGQSAAISGKRMAKEELLEFPGVVTELL